MKPPNFDRIARPYRWLEYLTLGKALERCRLHFLPQLLDRRRALILGDGDGRFTASLLAQDHAIEADAIDLSATMLALLRERSSIAPNAAARLRTHQANALDFSFETLPAQPYDLVVTHFFLDCLTQVELDALIARIVPVLAPGAIWLVSDFRIPSGPMRLPARVYIRSLYFAFRVLTGLRTTHLPDYSTPLRKLGFTRADHHHSLAGLLTTELWQRNSPPGASRIR